MPFRVLLLATLLLTAVPALADDVLHPGTPQFDRPTLMALGIKLPITGDDNHTARVTVRYRRAGASAWKQALPLYRVRPETVSGWSVEPQFSGSIFDLRPGTTYEVELHATDPDGSADYTYLLTATTRAVPRDPATPRHRPVKDVAGLKAALAGAQPGDIIDLADGVYADQFSIYVAGTADNPIVIRGASQEGTILDGGNCAGCNVLEVYGGGYVYIEHLTFRNATRALRFQTAGAVGNMVRRVHIRDTTMGIGSRQDQKDFYIADNILEGRLAWPSTYIDDNGAHANDDGISVQGFGHVVCHNRISGYGDAMKTAQDGARAVDFYGNDILWTYDNGIELDGSEANGRCLRNRFTNTYATLSAQPIYGGPAYLIGNVVVNVANEQMKLHALADTPPREPNGVFAYHNTFVSPGLALNLQTTATAHHFVVANNLFIGPPQPPGGMTVDWTGPVDDGVFDYNGYLPDGVFRFNFPALGGYKSYANFAALQTAGIETHGLLPAAPVFASGLAAPASYRVTMQAPDASLDGASKAIDRGLVLPNVNDGYTGSAPDLGALEFGCPAPIYGPRPEGIDESSEPLGCSAVRAAAAVHAATFAARAPVAAGALVSIFGENMGPETPAGAAALPLPAELAGVQVMIGGYPAPLVYVSAGQINCQVPWELAGQAGAAVVVRNGDAVSAALQLSLVAAAPGIFTRSIGGQLQAAALNADDSPNAPSAPARPGQAVQVFATGQGAVANPPATGAPAASSPFSETPAAPVVMIGDKQAAVAFSGLAPGLVGVWQVNVVIPADAPLGSAVPIQILYGGVASNSASLSISR
jgi:uncharacterized protein (TIGR03437 family)